MPMTRSTIPSTWRSSVGNRSPTSARKRSTWSSAASVAFAIGEIVARKTFDVKPLHLILSRSRNIPGREEGPMHPYLRQGMAEERIARLADDARSAEQRLGRRRLGALLIAAGERLGGQPRPEATDVPVGRLSEAA